MDGDSPIWMTREELNAVNSSTETNQELVEAVKRNNLQWLGAVSAFVLGLILAAVALVPVAQFAINSLGGH